jgi:hypothetical protein
MQNTKTSLLLCQKTKKRHQRESFVLSWATAPPRKERKSVENEKTLLLRHRAKKKTKKCAHLLLLLWRRQRLHHRRRLFILLPCITPRAPPSRLKHPRVLSLLSLFYLSRARFSFLSLSLAEKKKKRVVGEKRDQIRNEETLSVVERCTHALLSLPAWW